jgi:hypothetical protein
MLLMVKLFAALCVVTLSPSRQAHLKLLGMCCQFWVCHVLLESHGRADGAIAI